MSVLADRKLAFWTATAWDDLASMKAFRSAGAHNSAMRYLSGWCDEASVTRWVGPVESLRDWEAAHARMVAEGEPSRVKHPAPGQLARAWAPPRRLQDIAIRASRRTVGS